MADATDPAVTTLASDYWLSIPEAQRRIGWQEPALQLGEELRRALGERFGGLWFDEAGGGRVKVGVVGSNTADARALIERRYLATVTDLVPVRYSYNYLEAANARLGEEIARANHGTSLGLSTALLVNRNQVELSLPRGQRLTAAQHAVVDNATRRYGAALTLGSWAGRVHRTVCGFGGGAFHCDPPLRGGVSIWRLSTGDRCTAAFYAKSQVDDVRYMMTAGHCGGVGTQWSAFQPRTGSFHTIGAMHAQSTAGNDDFGIVTINNVSGWDPKPWVYVHATTGVVEDGSYGIHGVSTTGIDMRVCVSGAVSGTSCAKVEKLNVGGDFGLAQADLCVQEGDSGGPIYSDHLARGILVAQVAGAPFCSDAVYQGVIEAAEKLNVDVVHL